MFRNLRSLVCTGAVAIAMAVGLWSGSPTVHADRLPPGLEGVGIQQRLNQSIPLNLPFRDEHGQAVRLGDYFGRVPVVMTFNYFDCPMLCPLELNDLVRAMRAVSPDAGKDFLVLSVSIDPHDTSGRAAEKQQWYVERYGRSHGADGWHFLTGEQQAIDELTGAVGFHYQRDAQSGQLAHAAGIIVSTREGRLSRYLLGLEYSPRDLQFALMDAAEGRIGSLSEQLLLFCFHYDPEAGRYNFVVLHAVRAAGVMTVLGLAALMTMLMRRERRRASHHAE
ncbi:MAG TPA: SCO family protein [Vicinamibacterales bacterium]